MKKHNIGAGLFINSPRRCHIPKQPGYSHYSEITKTDSARRTSKYSHTHRSKSKKPTGRGGLLLEHQGAQGNARVLGESNLCD